MHQRRGSPGPGTDAPRPQATDRRDERSRRLPRAASPGTRCRAVIRGRGVRNGAVTLSESFAETSSACRRTFVAAAAGSPSRGAAPRPRSRQRPPPVEISCPHRRPDAPNRAVLAASSAALLRRASCPIRIATGRAPARVRSCERTGVPRQRRSYAARHCPRTNGPPHSVSRTGSPCAGTWTGLSSFASSVTVTPD